jgi:hypothetical protein
MRVPGVPEADLAPIDPVAKSRLTRSQANHRDLRAGDGIAIAIELVTGLEDAGEYEALGARVGEVPPDRGEVAQREPATEPVVARRRRVAPLATSIRLKWMTRLSVVTSPRSYLLKYSLLISV